MSDASELRHAIAIVGMVCRLPGAPDVATYWANLCAGVESVSRLSEEELRAAGVDPLTYRDPAYVRSAGGLIEDADRFDARFFGFVPREAEIMDPQHRVFLEGAYHALESAGVDPDAFDGLIGVFGGSGRANYLLENLSTQPDFLAKGGIVQATILSDADFLTTRVSYELNLGGPSVDVQTGCSTSMVATHLACQSLLVGDCDLALAGGVSITTLRKRGYLYEEGGTYSRDGSCRAFDAKASGMVGGNGMAIVALKRLDEAIDDGDTIHAVIRGTAINNDGAARVGFTAPGVDGQARVIGDALATAQVDARTIGYVEAHGTGTSLGDPIEVTALTAAFRADTEDRGFCGLGSVKSNIGHCNAAAGVASLIKSAMCVAKGRLVPSLHFETPNPEIDFENSPFRVVTEARAWDAGSTPRRAGISSFGMGGTNAHAVIEEPPVREPGDTTPGPHLLVLSAATETALAAQTDALATHLETATDLELADVAFTLQVGRRNLPHRRAVVATDRPDAIAALRDASRTLTGHTERTRTPVVFLFPGQGSQHVDMGRELYDTEPVFREHLDACAEGLRESLGFDLRDELFPAPDRRDQASERLGQTATTQPALFAIEYALARTWMAHGVQPAAMIGHSIGEYVAACLAGVFSLEDALRLVAARGRMMQDLPAGDMMTVSLTEGEVTPRLGDRLSLAAINGPRSTVVAGESDAVSELRGTLESEGVACRVLHTSHAFHSAMMDPIVAPFVELVQAADPQPAQMPCISSVTGHVIEPKDWADAEYWGQNLRQPVRFADAVGTALSEPDHVLLEVGPGRALSTLGKQRDDARGRSIVTSMRHPQENVSDVATLRRALGQLWLTGVRPDWAATWGEQRRLRVPLPLYPFERERYWIEPGAGPTSAPRRAARLDDWFYVPTWQRAVATPAGVEVSVWLIAGDADLGAAIASKLPGETHIVSARSRDEWTASFDAHRGRDLRVVLATSPGADRDATFWTAWELACAAGERGTTTHVDVVTSRLFDVTGEAPRDPGLATLLGPGMVAPLEFDTVSWRHIDIGGTATDDQTALADELARQPADDLVALRHGVRWLRTVTPLPLAEGSRTDRDGECVLITGGLGGVGRVLAKHLATTQRAKLVLVSRHGVGDDASRQATVSDLEAAGAEVMVAAADIADRAAMAAVVTEATRRFGKIDGVIHAAGLSTGGMLATRTRPDAEAVLAPKLAGTDCLAELLAGQPLRYFVLCSSLNSIQGAVGAADYCAANAYLDALARSLGTPFVSISWDAWAEVGMAAETEVSVALKAARAQALALGIRNDDGPELFERAIASGQRHLLVSTHDLAARLRPETVETEAAGEAETTEHARPDLQTDYVAPESDLQRALAGYVQELLGIRQVGLQDNLFELGFDSLLSQRLIARIKQDLEVTLPMESVLESPTVEDLAKVIEVAQWMAG